MKYGVRLPHFRHIAADVQRVGQSIRTVAKAAEDLGFHSVWVADHVVVPADPTSKYGSVWTEALTTLSFAAGCTDRVRLGTSILVAPYRHPLLAAKMLASLDALSAGRLDLGLAVGHLESEFEALGLDTFAKRGQITDEYIQAMKMLWSGEGTRYDGELIQVDIEKFYFEPRPLQQPMPLWIGGNSNRAARRLAEHGDYWQLVRPTVAQVADRSAELTRQCDKIGRDRSNVSVAVEHPMQIAAAPSVEELPLIGPVEHIIEQIRAYADLGAVHLTMDLFYGSDNTQQVDLAGVLTGMERFATEVMPHV
ncbi:MAG: TIGR03619 family F420-dependent LLM class oxidoreductase [Nocardioidaceae bacterium]|nr:MAG: TIGR03619 family F420-dependent LLM class oxidoreductase [Nocardioidaceae bacterium]